jgi:hypothetical protein
MIIIHGGENMGDPRLMLIQEQSDEQMPDDLKQFPISIMERMSMIQEEIDHYAKQNGRNSTQSGFNQILEDNGFNVWTSPIKDSYGEDLEEFKRFEFTPTTVL